MIGNLKGQREENLFLGIWDWDCQKFPWAHTLHVSFKHILITHYY
jgi:hypothetical protein